MRKIEKNVTSIDGGWVFQNGLVVENDNSKLISNLVSSYLIKVGRDESGWESLYMDPLDERLWELTYPESGQHGGGAPRLDCVSNELENRKYGYLK